LGHSSTTASRHVPQRLVAQPLALCGRWPTILHSSDRWCPHPASRSLRLIEKTVLAGPSADQPTRFALIHLNGGDAFFEQGVGQKSSVDRERLHGTTLLSFGVH